MAMTSSPESQTPSPTTAGPYPSVSLGQDVVSNFNLDATLGKDLAIHRLASWGPIVVFDAFNNELARNLYLVDLTQPAVHIIARAAAGDVSWTPDISGHWVVWTEYQFDHPGQGSQGSSHWKILALDLDSGTTTVVATGVHNRLTAGSAAPALARVDGDLVAYGVQDPRAGAPLGWSIIVKSLVTGDTIRTIDTDLDLYDFDISDGNVVYSEGKTDPDLDFKYDTRLMISTPSDATPLVIAQDAFEVAAGHARFAWDSDAAADADRSPLPEQPVVMTATFQVPSQIQTSVLTHGPPPPPDWGSPLLGALFPSTDGDYVGWQDRQTDGTWSGEVRRVGIWSASRGVAYELDGANDPVEVHLGGGWLTWNTDLNADQSDESNSLHGVELTTLDGLLGS